ncbi:MAG: hypothetical protein QM667_03175 [Asticcacaulis sp.]
MGDKSKPYDHRRPDHYWFRGSWLGIWPTRKEGWLSILICFGGAGLCFLLVFGLSALKLNNFVPYALIPMLILILAEIIITIDRTDWG